MCNERRKFKQAKTHTWPNDRVHMDYAHVNGVGLLLILVDVCSGWPEYRFLTKEV